MGRGLSLLQRTVLRVAAENRANGAQPSTYDFADAEVLMEHYRWPAERLCMPMNRAQVHAKPYGQLFHNRDIGANQHNSGKAALSRALRRLERRGLIQRASAFWKLTVAGVAAADKLAPSNNGRSSP